MTASETSLVTASETSLVTASVTAAVTATAAGSDRSPGVIAGAPSVIGGSLTSEIAVGAETIGLLPSGGSETGTSEMGAVERPTWRMASAQVSTAQRAASGASARCSCSRPTIASTLSAELALRRSVVMPSSTAVARRLTSRRSSTDCVLNASFNSARQRSDRIATSGRARSVSSSTVRTRSLSASIPVIAPLPPTPAGHGS